MTHEFDDTTPADAALKQRLRQLNSLPVDMAAFDRQLKAQLPPQQKPRRHWLAPLSALAASVLIIVSVALFALNGSTARAEPSQMIQFHENIVAGRVEAHAVSIEEARAIISTQSSGHPTATAPNNAPMDHLMACCMKPLKNKNVTCLMLEQDGVKITLSLAPTGQMATPAEGGTIERRDGQDYHIQQIHDYTMVMLDQSNLRLCLIARLPQEQLLKLATALKL